MNSNSFAFGWEKCRRIASRGNGLGLFISTTSYLSSTSDCSMLGQVEHNQKLFIAQAYEPLQVEIARGRGEFVDAFAETSKCNDHGKIVLMKEL